MNGGKVSVMAHSLGAVITYDILTGYLCGSVEDEIALMQQQQLHIPRRVIPHQQGLLFTVSNSWIQLPFKTPAIFFNF